MGDAELDALISSTAAAAPELSVTKRKPNHEAEETDDQQHEAKRSAVASRLNQVQATAAPTPITNGESVTNQAGAVVTTTAPVPKYGTTPIYVMPKRIGFHSTVFGLAEDLSKLKVQAATGEGAYTEVNFYIVNLNDSKQKAFYAKSGRRAVSRADADKAIGLQRAFRFGPARAVGPMLKPLGILGEMSQGRDGVPRFAMRNHLLMLGPTVDPKDKLPEYIQVTGADGKVRWLSTLPFQFTAQTSLDALKRLIKHLFGCIYDGDSYGTTEMRKACLIEVLTEMSREQPGSQLFIPTETEVETIADEVDETDEANKKKASLTLATGQVLTINDAEVKKRVRARFIDRCVGPFRADTNDEVVRKNTHWSAPDTILLARHKVFRSMNADELAQAKSIMPGRTRPVFGSWPVDRPEPTKEDFDDPNKMDECVWYANSKGYVVSPIVYKNKDDKPFEMPVEEAPEPEEELHEPNMNIPTQEDAPMTFVYKRPKYAKRIVTSGSIVAVDLRIRMWCNKPSKNNPTGAVGAHVDFTPTIIVMERRENDAGGNNSMGSALATEMSAEDMARMFAETGGEFAPMTVPVSE